MTAPPRSCPPRSPWARAYHHALPLALTLAGCERAAPEPAPGPRATTAHAPSSRADDASAPLARAPASPPATTDNAACALLPESTARGLAAIPADVPIEREPSELAGLYACRYRWRKPEARAIEARNAERAARDPRLLAAVAGRGRAGPSSLESAWAELRVSVFPPRSGTEPLWARGFSLAHPGEIPVPGVGDQASFHRERRVLSVRKGPRTIEVLARPTDDPDASLDLARRVAVDALARL
jgi:hypothetical protein